MNELFNLDGGSVSVGFGGSLDLLDNLKISVSIFRVVTLRTGKIVSFAFSKKVPSVWVNGSNAAAGATGMASDGVTDFGGESETTAATGLVAGIPEVVEGISDMMACYVFVFGVNKVEVSRCEEEKLAVSPHSQITARRPPLVAARCVRVLSKRYRGVFEQPNENAQTRRKPSHL